MWPFTKAKRFDEPTALNNFFNTIKEKVWTDEKLLESLDKIFVALNELIRAICAVL